MAEKEEGNIKQEYNLATTGLNLDQSLNQVPKGQLTYALNASVENFDSNSVNYQNEPGNEFCVEFPQGYALIGSHFIVEKNKQIFFISNAVTGGSQIGYMDNNDCTYRVLVNAPCLNFNINHPIHKCVHRITNCSTEIYWTDGVNPRRYLDIDDIPKILRFGSPLCSPVYTDDVDCNQLKLQPNFNIPNLSVVDVVSGGNLIAGTYQFAIQYSDPVGNPFTSYYSVTNPTPIADTSITTANFNYPVGKSIVVSINNLDSTGQFQYFNLAVIKTINAISSVSLVGTYFIENSNEQITYTGQSIIELSINDIFEKFPYYEIAQDLTAVQDILVWDQLTSIDRINYQQIANKITLEWESWRIPSTENYADEINATNLRGYLRDEVYAFEIVFLLRNGKQTDGFHIPGRAKNIIDSLLPNIPATDPDFIGNADPDTNSSSYWKIYNTGTVAGFSSGYSSSPSYKGPYQYGEFSYWESTDEYPCNTNVWGDLAGQKIRHHKFPDVAISPIYESKLFTSPSGMVMGNNAVFPIGVKLDTYQIQSLISTSDLTTEEKEDIVGFKIVRGDRSTNKSIVAKGMLRNVGEYSREEQKFFFANYPYNDLTPDPFLNTANNAYAAECNAFDIDITLLMPDPVTGINSAVVEYYDCNTNKLTVKKYTEALKYTVCSIGKPRITNNAEGIISYTNYDVYSLDSGIFGNFEAEWDDITTGITQQTVYSTEFEVRVVVGTIPVCIADCGGNTQIRYVNSYRSPISCGTEAPLDAVTDDNRYRQIFNSPETSFGQPFLGDVLKLESVMFGSGKGHFVQVKDNAKYKLLSEAAQRAALESSERLGGITTPFNATAMFTAYQAYLTIYVNGITRRNYAYSFNSIADYNYGVSVPDTKGLKQRTLDISTYLIPGVQAVGDTLPINNYQRESSVYLRTDISKPALPFPDNSPNMLSGSNSIVTDQSRFTISEIGNCSVPAKEEPVNVVSYYASLKNVVTNQWGQIYSYDTLDTGYQYILNSNSSATTVFGGDTFISRFAFKTKLPFFIDNRVNAPDDSDIFYDEIGNIAYPKYWHSSRSILKNYAVKDMGIMSNIISYKAHNFDCSNDGVVTTGTATTSLVLTTTTTTTIFGEVTPSSTLTYYDGYFYLFAYGVPNFYCESSYNTDLRQAFNNREGDFWPHVSTDIPDDWVQESFVSIANDNTYTYNTSFSKQNRENTFTHLPGDWEEKLCYTIYPFRAIYSDLQNTDADNRVNNWLVYRAVSYFDFPQNYGNLITLDGIQNKAVLARFENKTLMYNNLLTMDTSNPQAAYLGNPTLFKGAPPIDFAETDLGYVGTQHKMLLKIPQGQVTVDAKRGQVFLITGTQVTDLSGFGSGMNRFFTDHLAFEILRFFPKVNIDNHFNGIGLHGVYDSKYDRIIITKLDYTPTSVNVKYNEVEKKFYYSKIVNGVTINEFISTSNSEYFCNKSWTLSFNLNTKSWISFHSYIPNWYIAENNFFYSGLNNCCDDFEFIAATGIVPVPFATTTTTTTDPFATTTTTSTSIAPSTTTTTTYQIFPTTTTTTTEALDCTITATVVETDCNLEGTGVIIEPTTTSTTTIPPTTTTTTTATPTTTTTTTQPPTTTTTTTTIPLTTTTTTIPLTTTTTTTTETPTTTTTTTETPTTTTTTTAEPTTTTTSTTTPVSTTTTTTTLCPDCRCYAVFNEGDPSNVNTTTYTDCNGEPASLNNLIFESTPTYICATAGTILDGFGITSTQVVDGPGTCNSTCPVCTTTTTTTQPPTTTTTSTTGIPSTTTTTTLPVTTTTTTTILTFAINIYICGDICGSHTGGIGIMAYNAAYSVGQFFELATGRVGEIIAITNTTPITDTVVNGPYADCATALAAVCP